jgi:hypothetical protein
MRESSHQAAPARKYFYEQPAHPLAPTPIGVIFSMPEDLVVVACLRLDEVPQLLIQAPEYERSSCDFCAASIWVLRKAHFLVASGGAAKACTWCISSGLQVYTEAVIKLSSTGAHG